MRKCGLNYQMDTLHNAYSNQHIDPIEYTCDVMNTLLQFEMQKTKSFINLDHFLMLSKLIKQSANIC